MLVDSSVWLTATLVSLGADSRCWHRSLAEDDARLHGQGGGSAETLRAALMGSPMGGLVSSSILLIAAAPASLQALVDSMMQMDFNPRLVSTRRGPDRPGWYS